MRLILLIFLLTHARHALAETGAVSETRFNNIPLHKIHAPLKRKLLAVDPTDGKTASDGDGVKHGNDTESEIDKAAFAIEVDTDDPQGVYLPLEKLKMMLPGPGVKPRPRLPSKKDIKKKDQAVKRRRRRNAIRSVQEKSLLFEHLFPRDKSPEDFSNRRLVEKTESKSNRVVKKTKEKQFYKYKPVGHEVAETKFKRIRRDGKFQNRPKSLTRGEGELKQGLGMNNHPIGPETKEESDLPLRGNMDDHRTKEWLKKELNSIETLMNATKHRFSKVSPGDKEVISPQLERDLQRIDHDIHVDLKHVSKKRKHDDESDRGMRNLGPKGDHFDHPVSHPVHSYYDHRNIEMPRRQSQHRNSQDYESGRIYVDSRGDFGGDSNEKSNVVDVRETARLGDSQRVGEHRKMPDVSRMLDELEWIKHQTDVVRSKTRKIEHEMRMDDGYNMNRRPDVQHFDERKDRLPEEHNIHVSIRHGGDSGRSRTAGYFQRHTGDIPHKHHHGERVRVPDNEDLFQERQRQRESAAIGKSKPMPKHKDKTIISTFDRLQHDLKALRMKMEARDKFDGTYNALDTEPIPKVPPIYNEKYFRGEPVENAVNERTHNRTVDRKYVDQSAIDMKDLDIKTPGKRKKGGMTEEHEDFEKEEEEEIRPHGGELHLSSRRKRSINERRSKEVAKFLGKRKREVTASEDGVNGGAKVQVIRVVHKLNQLISTLSILKQLRYLDTRMKDKLKYWRAYKSLVNQVQQRLTFYLITFKRFRLKQEIMRRFGNVALASNSRNSGSKSNLNNYVTHQTESAEMRLVKNDRNSDVTDSLIFGTEKSDEEKQDQKGFNVVDGEQQKNKIKMKIDDSSPSSVKNIQNTSQNIYDTPMQYSMVDKRLHRIRRRRARNRETKNEPISKTEKALASEFSQLLKLLPESKQEKDSENKLFMDDMKKEKAFDIGQTVRNIDNQENKDADFLKESLEANYLLANSRIKRRNAKTMSNGKFVDFSNMVKMKHLRDQNANDSQKTAEYTRIMRSKRNVNAISSENLTTTTQVGNEGGVDIDADAQESSAQRDGNILDKNVLHMMDFYEGKEDDSNLRAKRHDVQKRKAAAKFPRVSNSWIPSENYRQYPGRVDDSFDADYEPSYLDTFFPQAYASLRNARDRMRWFQLLDGEDRLARQVGYLNNMADRLIEEETDPVLQFLNHVQGQGEPDKYRSWARTPTKDYYRRDDHGILREAINDFNNNEHERNSYLNQIRKRRDTTSDKHISKNEMTKKDRSHISTGSQNVGEISPKIKDNDYQFDESQIEEIDDDEGDKENNEEEEEDEEEEEKDDDDDDDSESNGEFDDKRFKDYEDEDNDDEDDVVDEKTEGKEKGIEVDDNGREVESEEPFAFIERKLTPKNKASVQVEYFWGSWSPCSQTCGIGQRFRSNMCGQDQPCGGRQASTETEVCADILDC